MELNKPCELEQNGTFDDITKALKMGAYTPAPADLAHDGLMALHQVFNWVTLKQMQLPVLMAPRAAKMLESVGSLTFHLYQVVFTEQAPRKADLPWAMGLVDGLIKEMRLIEAVVASGLAWNLEEAAK